MDGSLTGGLVKFFADGLYGQITDPTKAAMIVFITLYCGYVGSMEYGGPIKGFTRLMADKGKKTVISVQLRAWAASVGAFFSDLGSPGIVGTLFREKYNEVKLSRERLGITINLTAVPVCSMIPIVGWGLFAIGILNNTSGVADPDLKPISMFLHSIPYFCLSLLAVITPLLLLRQDFVIGRLAGHDSQARNDSSRYIAQRKKEEAVIELAKEDGKGITLFVSLIVMVSVLLLLLKELNQSIQTAEVYPFMISLGIAFVAASLTAMLLKQAVDKKPFMKSFALYSDMFKRTVSVTGIMVASWIFFDVAWQTGIYQNLTEWLGRWLPAAAALPLLFLLGAALSYLTGSAWGTYAVVMPLGILLSQAVGISVYAGIGAAVSSGVYGDISAADSHAMHYSAQSAGVSKDEFKAVQKPYMHRMAAACVVSYGAGALIDRWYGYMAIAAATYIVLILIENRRQVKTEV